MLKIADLNSHSDVQKFFQAIFRFLDFAHGVDNNFPHFIVCNNLAAFC